MFFGSEWGGGKLHYKYYVIVDIDYSVSMLKN